jgi:hypothetical protein
MGKSSAPSAPDPYTSAAAQYTYGTQAASYNAALNNVNTVNPMGSTSFNVTGTSPTGAPEYTESTQLNPQQQQIYNIQQGNEQTTGQTAANLAGQVQKSLAQPLPSNPNAPTLQSQINTSGVPGIVGSNDLDQYTQQQQQAAYANQMQYIQPQLQQQQEQLDNQLKESGAQPGSAAYNNAMQLFQNQAQQQQTNAYNNSYQTGLQAQQALYGESANTNQQMFGEAATQQQADNQALASQYGLNTQQLQNYIALQQTPLNEYNSLMSGVSANLPSFDLAGQSSGASAAAPNIMQAMQNQYEGQLAQYNAGVSQSNSEIGDVVGLVGAAASYY